MQTTTQPWSAGRLGPHRRTWVPSFRPLRLTYKTLLVTAIAHSSSTVTNYWGKIKIARRHDISFLATGGRHGASLGFGTVNNALHIDLSQLNRFEIDSQANTITIGGAVRTGQIVGPLHEAGKEIREWSHSTAPSVFRMSLKHRANAQKPPEMQPASATQAWPWAEASAPSRAATASPWTASSPRAWSQPTETSSPSLTTSTRTSSGRCAALGLISESSRRPPSGSTTP